MSASECTPDCEHPGWLGGALTQLLTTTEWASAPPPLPTTPNFHRSQVFGHIYKNRIKIKNFFVDFDRHMRGIITAEQFKSAIHGMVRDCSTPVAHGAPDVAQTRRALSCRNDFRLPAGRHPAAPLPAGRANPALP